MVRAFDLLGNIAIVNFPRDWKGNQKKKFTEKLMKDNKVIETVLEKSGKIKGRLRKMITKHIAGKKTKEVLYRENDCVFRFNLDTTYFSPRLSNERKEVASKIKKKDKVLVMFAGVGPFSIVIAKKTGAEVVSNEINREANKYGRLNVELNKLKDKIEFWDGDIKRIVGKWEKMRSQVRRINKKLLIKKYKGDVLIAKKSRAKLPEFNVIVMPRPQLKETFLKEAFRFSKRGTNIYYYDFCKVGKEKEIVEKIKQEAKKARKKIKILKVKKAGEIAPYKIRVRVDFRVL